MNQPQPTPDYKTKERVSLTLDYKLYHSFRELCKKEMRSKSKVVENAIKRYVEARA